MGKNSSRVSRANFKQFVAFIKKESDIVCNPITSLQSLREDNSEEKTGRTLSTEAGSTEEEQSDTSSDNSETPSPRSSPRRHQPSKRPPCCYCQGSHIIVICFKFRKMPYEQRVAAVRERRLCFSCLRKGYVAVDCPDQALCDMCGKPIPHCCTTPAVHGQNGSLQITLSQRQSRTVKHTVYSNIPTPRGSMDRCVAAHGLRIPVRARSKSQITCLLPVRGGCTPLILRQQQVKMLELR